MPSTSKISDSILPSTKEFFGIKKQIMAFLDELCTCSNVALVATKMQQSLMEIYDIISIDDALKKLVHLAIEYSLDIAEGKLYERAVIPIRVSKRFKKINLEEFFLSKDLEKAIATELYNITTNNKLPSTSPKAVEIAAFVHKWTKRIVDRANRADAKIEWLPGFITRQSH